MNRVLVALTTIATTAIPRGVAIEGTSVPVSALAPTYKVMLEVPALQAP